MGIWNRAFTLLVTSTVAMMILYTPLCASKERGSRIVVASFSTLDEAQKGLNALGDSIDPDILRLVQKNDCKITARASGAAYIVVLEPIMKSAVVDTLLHYIKKEYPDAYVAPYFGPTKGAIPYDGVARLSSTADQVSLRDSTQPIQTCQSEKQSASVIIGYGIAIVIMIGLGIVVWIRFRSKNNRLNAEELSIPSVRTDAIQKELDVPLWRYEDAYKRSHGDDALLKEQIDQFLIHAPKMISALRKMVAVGDFSGLRSNAHALKGLAASIAAHALRIASKNIEFAARDENRTLIDIVFVRCEKIARETIEVIEESLAKNLLQVKPVESNSVEIAEQLDQITDKMVRSIFVDTDEYELFDHEWDESMDEMIAELKVKINRLEFTMALEQIIHIKKALGYE